MKKWMVIAAIAGIALSACGEPEQSDYTAETKDAFLSACTNVEGDPLLTSRLCVCVFDQAQARLSFTQFKDMEQRLINDPVADLPLAFDEIVADCVIEEADL